MNYIVHVHKIINNLYHKNYVGYKIKIKKNEKYETLKLLVEQKYGDCSSFINEEPLDEDHKELERCESHEFFNSNFDEQEKMLEIYSDIGIISFKLYGSGDYLVEYVSNEKWIKKSGEMK
jgi:hypothetical protein